MEINSETQAKLIADLKRSLSVAAAAKNKASVLEGLKLAYSYASALDCTNSEDIKTMITEIEQKKGRLQNNDLSNINNFCNNFLCLLR